MPKFVHLHLHSSFSLLDGLTDLKALPSHVKSLGMDSVALTDHGNMYGSMKFIDSCKEHEIKPICGLEAYTAPLGRLDRSERNDCHLTLLARTGEGLHNLFRLSSLAFLEGYYYKPRIDLEILSQHSKGIICLSGCVASEFSSLLLSDNIKSATELAIKYKKIFKNDFYIEVQNNGIQIQRDHAVRAIDVANRLGIPVVATSDCHYLEKSDYRLHDLLLCINTKASVNESNRFKFDGDLFFVRSPADMASACQQWPDEYLAQSCKIAEGVEENYASLDLGSRQYPSFAVPKRAGTAEDHFISLCRQGLKNRFLPGASPSGYAERLEHEISIICKMGFASYFLIVWDLTRFCREHNIPNSARGSACGALVSYSLYISHVDPIEHGLLFERFIDPSRLEPPDIDIDVCKERREEVIQYIKNKYGSENVAQICTFGTMAARAAIKDVARALGITYAESEQIAQFIPTKPVGMTIDKSLEKDFAFRAYLKENRTAFNVVKYARGLEGTTRSVGVHAAGVVIGPRPLADSIPIQKHKESNDIVTQWDMGDIEKAGYLKMDILGLRNMTMLASCTKMIQQKTGDAFDPLTLPLDDGATYELLRNGHTKGVFQLDAPGIANLTMRIRPDRFKDISVILAVYRPGPLESGMVDNYVECKHGNKQPDYAHPILEEILGSTYGLMVFQEQIMMVLHRLGGVSLTQAYTCIKAISKKKAADIAKHKQSFIEGCERNSVKSKISENVFSLIEYFASYGFNMSHATAYAHLSYITAYLKAHHPTEFFAALLSSEMGGSEREKYLAGHIRDTQRSGIKIDKPDINTSTQQFTPLKECSIIYGLGAIKGVTSEAARAIATERNRNGDFHSTYDFFSRLNHDVVRKQTAEALIHAGAFDSLSSNRRALVESLPAAYKAGKKRMTDVRNGQSFMFSDPIEQTTPDNINDYSHEERIHHEMESLGFYTSGSPINGHESTLAKLSTNSVAAIESLGHGASITIGGWVAGLYSKVKQSKDDDNEKASRITKFAFDDGENQCLCLAWAETSARLLPILRSGSVGFVVGKVSKRDGFMPAIIVDNFVPISKAIDTLSRGMVIELDRRIITEQHVEQINRVVRSRPGKMPVFFACLGTPGVKRAIYRAGQEFNVEYSDALIGTLERAAGIGCVSLIGAKKTPQVAAGLTQKKT